MDSFAYAVTPADGPFEWEGEDIILTLKVACSPSNATLFCKPGGMDDFFPIAIFSANCNNFALDLPFAEKVAFKAEGGVICIAGIVERVDATPDTTSDESDDDSEAYNREVDAPGLVLDSDFELESDKDSGSETQNVTIEEAFSSDSENDSQDAKQKALTEQKSNLGADSVTQSTDDSKSTTSENMQQEKKEDHATESNIEIKADLKSAPLKSLITTDTVLPEKSGQIKKQNKKRTAMEGAHLKAIETKATETKKILPKAEVKKKVEKKKEATISSSMNTSPVTKDIEPGVRKVLPGGVSFEVLSVGTSSKAAVKGKKITVGYKGTLKSGKQFDSGNLTFQVGSGQVVPGFDKGVEGMLVGEKRRILIPAKLGYGNKKVGGIPPNSDLIFEISLRNVN